MDYESKFKAILKVQTKKVNEKKREIAEQNKALNVLNKKINERNRQIDKMYKEIEAGGGIGSASFFGSMDENYAKKIENEKDKINKVKKRLLNEYNILKKKKEQIEELDMRREKQFIEEVDREKERKIEDLNVILRILDEDGGG